MEEPREPEVRGKGKTLSRRQLFPMAGKVALGAAGLSVVGAAVGCGDEENGETTASNGGCDLAGPWPYTNVSEAEITAAQEAAYENWYKYFCCYATASGIMHTSAEAGVEPYASYPLRAMEWGHGGGVGWGATCGTLTGAANALGLIVGYGADGEDKTVEDMINDLFNWYTVTELPIFQPAEPKVEITSVNASDSPLCHVSVGKWMAKENVKFFSDPRKDRCARLSADVAGKALEFLNQWADGTYVAANPGQAKKHEVQMPAQNNCTECHGENVPASPGA